LNGFHFIIPKSIISILTPEELELLICGLPNIDIKDLKSNCEFDDYDKNSKVVKWLFETLEEYS